MRQRVIVLAVLFSLAVPACGDDSLEAVCCPLEVPTCDCFSTGGSRDLSEESPFRQCAGLCDAEPDGWEEYTDSNGCPALRWVGGTGSCFNFVDAGPAPQTSTSDAQLSF